MRLLGAVRLSRDTDDTTSPVRQRQAIESFAALGGHRIVGIAEDIDVSGAIPPDERPELGPWLARPDEWDAIIVHKPDRLSRSLRDFLNLFHDLKEHGKSIISIDPALDFSTDQGRLVANVLLAFAEFERSMIASRVKDSHRYIKQDGGYPGGQIPFGYIVRRRESGKGWEYAHHPDYGPIVREIAERAIAGVSMRQIALWLNASEIPTSRDLVRISQGNAPRGAKWTTESVRALFTSPAIAGFHASNGEALRDSDGLMVRRCEGILTRDMWEQLKTAITGTPHKAHRVDANPLLQVAFCARDGAPLYSTGDPDRNHRFRYYRCALVAKAGCTGRNVPADELERWTATAFLGQVGDVEIIERIPIPAEDHSRELAETEEAISYLDSEYKDGALHARAYSRMVSQLEEKRDHLRSLPSRPASFEERPTGETFGQRWERGATQERRRLMKSAGFEVRASRDASGFTFGFQIDPELAARAQAARAGHAVAVPGHDAIQASWESVQAGNGSTVTAASVAELIEKLGRR